MQRILSWPLTIKAQVPPCSREIGQVAYLGVGEGTDPIRRVIDKTQISRAFYAGCRYRVIYDIVPSVACGDYSDFDLVGNADRQQPHQLSAADIGDEGDPGEAQQARRVGRGQSRAIEFLLDEVEIVIRRSGLQDFARFRVLPLAHRTNTSIVTWTRHLRGFLRANLRTLQVCRSQAYAHQACRSPRARQARRR